MNGRVLLCSWCALFCVGLARGEALAPPVATAAPTKTPAARLELEVGQKRRLPLAHVARVSLPRNEVCRLREDPLSGAHFIEALSPGHVRLRLEGLRTPEEREVLVVVRPKKMKSRAPVRKSVVHAPIHLLGWEP